MDKKEQKEFYRKEFLKKLTDLSKKYEVYIAGCGCCGSPYLTGEPHQADGGNLRWDLDKGCYKIDEK